MMEEAAKKPMNITQLKRIIEASILVADSPLSVERIAALFDEEERPTNKEIKQIIEEISKDYASRGIELKEVASGYRFQAQADLGRWVSRLWLEKAPRYSRAFLETLALIAYKQPITRAEIEDIRGVAVSTHFIKTMQDRNWIKVIGYRDVPGKPGIYGTTKEFLDYFNLKSLADLPELMALQDIESLPEQLEVNLSLVQSDEAKVPPQPAEAELEAEVVA